MQLGQPVEGTRGFTRRRFLARSGGAVLALAAARVPRALAVDAPPPPPRYRSRPDLNPPPITVETGGAGGSGYIFLAPFDISAGRASYSGPVSASHSGPLIVDAAGEPVWFLPLASKTAMDFRVQRYRRRPVLTWYEGTVLGAYGGDYVVFDPTYHEIARVQAAGGRHGDLHEFLLTERGSALITIYRELKADLTSVGGAADARLVEGIVQEIDVATGRLLFEWRSIDHVPVDESFRTNVTPDGNVDYFHLNSIAVDLDGSLLISSRHTSTVYKVDRRSGRVLWRLGGKRSDFTFGPGAAFSFQHDVRRHPDGSLTVFDNAAAEPGPGVSSRGIRLALDEKRRHVALLQEFKPPPARAGWAMGNVQLLDGGAVFIGWGTDGSFSQFDRNGDLTLDARFADGSVGYRSFRLAWTGRPTGAPAVAAETNADGGATIYASWNGATQVAGWQVLAGTAAGRLRGVASAPRQGFETSVTIPAGHTVAAVAAVGRGGERVGLSRTLLL